MDAPLVAALVLLALLLGAAGGAWLATALLRSRADATTAALRTERDLLRARTSQLESSAAERADSERLVAPLAAALGRVEQQVATLERDRVEQYAGLREQVGGLLAVSEALRGETATLSGALRSPNARGSWGEVHLRRVVEHAGMLNRVDFTEQATVTTETGTVRPDLVVHLPGGKQVVVDAKAPMAAFLEERYPAHAQALRRHVDVLAGKQYWAAFPDAPELVVCFVPGEAFLAAACEADPALLEHAMARRVVLATPTTLLALLRTVAVTWQQDALAGAAREVYDVGRELYGRLGTLGERANTLGRSLQRAVEGYNGLVATLETRVLVSARRMRDLGVVAADLDVVTAVEQVPRPLTAPELLAALDDPDDGAGLGAAMDDPHEDVRSRAG